jgi:hypothetical protein
MPLICARPLCGRVGRRDELRRDVRGCTKGRIIKRREIFPDCASCVGIIVGRPPVASDRALNTNSYFKKGSSSKNMRNRMITDGRLQEEIAPSYCLERPLWNVPNDLFGSTYWKTIENCINYIAYAETTKFHCANDLHWPLREGSHVNWSPKDFEMFMVALKKFWA